MHSQSQQREDLGERASQTEGRGSGSEPHVQGGTSTGGCEQRRAPYKTDTGSDEGARERGRSPGAAEHEHLAGRGFR